MKIAAITKFKHGGLHQALKQLSWTQTVLSEKTGISPHIISNYFTLKARPSVKNASLIEKVLVEAGVDFDASVEWPEAFVGFRHGIKIEQVQDISSKQLEAFQQYYLSIELNRFPSARISEGDYDPKGLENALHTLTERQTRVLGLYYGLNGEHPRTETEISKMFKISRARVNQIHRDALLKMRNEHRIVMFAPEKLSDDARKYEESTRLLFEAGISCDR
jgi:transcriptional regulator with XRE-family HTH domain